MLSLEKDAGGAMHGTDRPVHAWIQNGVRHPPYSGTDRNGAITHRIQRSQPEGLKAAAVQQYVCPGMQQMRLRLIKPNANAATPRVTRRELQQRLFHRFRSEERRVGKEGVSTCSARWSPQH